MRIASIIGRACAALVAAAALTLPAAAANAHDVIESTNPANGSTVGPVPTAIELTFDHTPIAIGSKIVIKDPTGADQASGDASVVDNVVTQAIKPGAPAGTYAVEWRVVSSDSHPIEGTFTFTATAAGGSSGSPQGSGPTTAGTVPSSSAAGDSHETAGAGIPWWVVAGGVVVVLAIVALGFAVRRAVASARTDE